MVYNSRFCETFVQKVNYFLFGDTKNHGRKIFSPCPLCCIPLWSLWLIFLPQRTQRFYTEKHRDYEVAGAKNYGRKMLPSSFIYVVLVVGMTPGGRKIFTLLFRYCSSSKIKKANDKKQESISQRSTGNLS